MSSSAEPTPTTATAERPATQPVPPAPPAKPGRFRGAWAGGVVGLLLVALGAAGGFVAGYKPAAGEKEPEKKPEEESADKDEVKFPPERWNGAGLRIEPAAEGPLADFAWRSGRVTVNEERVAHVSLPVEGVIRSVKVKLGQEVKAGDVLAVVDSREVGVARLDLVRARVALEAEKTHSGWAASTATNAADLAQAMRDAMPFAEIEKRFRDKPMGDWRQQLLGAYVRRNQTRDQLAAVRTTGGSGISEASIRKMEADSETAESALISLLEEIRQNATHQRLVADVKIKEAETALASARARMALLGFSAAEVDRVNPLTDPDSTSLYEVRAILPGVVIDKHAVVGERATAQFQLFQIADLSSVWVQADVFEPDLPLVDGLAGKQIPFRVSDAPASPREATVFDPGQVFDRGSRAVTLTAAAPNPGRVLKPGQFVEVGLPRGTGTKPVLQVPVGAIQRHEGRTFVFVQTGEEGFRAQTVLTGRVAGDRVEIQAGLKPGDPVVVAGGFALKSVLLKDLIQGE